MNKIFKITFYALWMLMIILVVLTGSERFYHFNFMLLTLWLFSRWLVKYHHDNIDAFYHVPTESIHVGDEVELKYFIYNYSIIPVWNVLIDYAVDPRVKSHFSLKERVFLKSDATLSYPGKLSCLRRGFYKIGQIKVTFSDPLGFFTREKHFRNGIVFTVLPRVYPLSLKGINGLSNDGKNTLKHQFVTESSEIESLKKYILGDPLKHIHWKVSAKEGQWMVKRFSPTFNEAVVIAIDGANAIENNILDELNEEQLISHAASLIYAFLKSGQSVHLILNGESLHRHFIESTRDFHEALLLLTSFRLCSKMISMDFYQHLLHTEEHVLLLTPSLHQSSDMDQILSYQKFEIFTFQLFSDYEEKNIHFIHSPLGGSLEIH